MFASIHLHFRNIRIYHHCQQGQQGRLREFPVAARVAEERDQDRGDTQGSSAQQARGAGEVSRAGHRGTLSGPHALKATPAGMAFSGVQRSRD